MKKWIILLFLIVSMSEAERRCIQTECTEWIWISKPCGTERACYTETDGTKTCYNKTKYCRTKGGCAQRACTKWEKIIEKIEDAIDPGGKVKPGFSGAIRG